MSEFKVDEKLKPLDYNPVDGDEFNFLATMLGELNDIEKVLISFQNKLLVENMKLPLGDEGLEQRMMNRTAYSFYNKLRTAIYNYKKRKSVKR